ncbi:acyl-CoA thioesterase [Deinococcus sp.]|uniref:acyl-CoA thioesterase n=1 Tax=Deinococcus sp. TaxID=47478 RepID=UPI003C7D6A50
MTQLPADQPPSDPASLYPVSHSLRVRWAEVDAQGVVFNGHYLTYADVCCTEYFRAAGLPQWNVVATADSPEDTLDSYVVRATLDYKSSARFDDLLTLRGRISRLGNSSFTFECRMERAGVLLCTVTAISVNAHQGVSRPLPEHFRAAVLAFQGEG